MKELQLEKLDAQATRYLNDISNGDYLYLIRDKFSFFVRDAKSLVVKYDIKSKKGRKLSLTYDLPRPKLSNFMLETYYSSLR